MPLDDRALTAALVAGSPDGLEDAYRAYADRLYTTCRGLLDDPEQAADAVHDTFVVASQRADRLRDPERLLAWLRALARNECLRRLRGRARRAAGRAPQPEAEPGPEPGSLLPAPALLWPRLQLNCFDPGVELEREAIVRRAGRFDRRTGFPRPVGWRRRRRLVVAGLAAVAVAVLAAGAGTAIRPDATAAPGGDPNPIGAAPSTSPTRPPARSPSPSATSRATPSPTPGPSSPAPPPARRPARPPAQPPATSSASLTVDASGDVSCLAGGLFGYRLEVTATASRSLRTGELHVATGGGTETYGMAVDGPEASAESDLMASPELEWWVEVTGAGGQSAETAPVTVTQPCT